MTLGSSPPSPACARTTARFATEAAGAGAGGVGVGMGVSAVAVGVTVDLKIRILMAVIHAYMSDSCIHE